jgi:hypothetical protein
MVNRLTPTGFIDGLTTSNFRSTLFGTSSNGAAIAAARWNNVPAPLSGMTLYGTMIAWSGDSDTQGFLAINYETPGATVGGGYGNFISWSKRLAFSDGTGASGTWGINITGNSATVGGFTPSQSTIANGIVVRDPSGYIFGNYINMSDDGNPGGGTSITSFITKQGDNYYRSVSPTNAMASIRGVASGTWGINITGSAGSAGSVDFNNITNKTGGTGTYQTSGDFRAPIFYDSNDTTYYGDFAGTSLFNVVRVGVLADQTFAQLNICQGRGAATTYRDIDIKGTWAAGEGHAITATHGGASTNIVGQMVFEHNSPGSRIKWGRLYDSGDQSTFPMQLISQGSSAYLEMNTGSMRSPQFRFTNSGNNAYFTGEASWGARIYTDSGYIWFGPANSSYAHIYTDRGQFYFNADILINGTAVVKNDGGTWGINISGNAATATNLTNNQNNWSSVGGLTNVIGLLAWKNYGNNHVIFDASQGTSPSGGGVNQTNATVAWSATYPTLMGWNGSQTYGVRVDSARVADSSGSASSVAWSGVSAGYRENYDLGFRPSDNSSSYAGFRFGSPGNDSNAGYFLIRGGADTDVYTQNGITIVADLGWLTLAQRTTASRGVRIMTGSSTSTVRASFATDGSINFIGDPIASSSFRAPIFYDSDDTGYYADFNSTSNSAMRVRGGTLYGPNPTWGRYLQVGGNGNQNTDYASVVTTDGNLHLDSRAGNAMYLNYYANGIIYLNGATYYISSNGAFYNGTASNSNTVGNVAAGRIVYGGASDRQGVNQISNWDQSTFPDAAFLSSESATANAPTTDFTYGVQTSFHRSGPNYRTQFVTSLYGNNVYWLRQLRDSAGWSSWVQVLHSGNFNSYAPTLTGGGASGTWSINITGSAGSASSATSATFLNSSNYINQTGSTGSWNADFNNTPAGTARYGGDVGANQTNNPGGSWWIQQNFRHTNSSNSWGIQVAWGWEDNANRLATRNITGGNFGGWVYYLNSSNFTSYAAPNGGVLTNTFNFQSNLGGYCGSLSSPPLQAYSTGNNSAFFSFHKAGVYAVNMGLDADNVLRIGGWSAAANRWQLDMSGNQTVAGTSTATGFFESSDSRFKQLVQDDYRAIGVQNIKPKLYIKDGKEEVGYFAQDFQSILSSAVSENNEGFLNLSYTQVHTMKIANLEDSVEALKEKILYLENQLKQK